MKTLRKLQVWGHRGALGYAPENTLESFRVAKDMRVDGVELDVQLSKDGHLVVIHDETIDRVSNGSGWVNEYTLKELKSYNYKNNHPDYPFVSIPTLEEVYQLFKGTGIFINVELKTGIIFYDGIEEKVLSLTQNMGMEDKVLYSSFNHYTLMNIKQLNSEARVGVLHTDGFIDVPGYSKRMDASAVHPTINNLKYPGYIDSCKNYGLEVNVWNIRDENIRYCCEAGVNSVITNFPDRTREIVNDFYKD